MDTHTLLTFCNTNINVMKYCLLFHHSFFFLDLMGHILILLRSVCLCAVLIFSSSLMHCCIIYIPQYNKPPLPSTDTKPYFTQSHSPWRDRKDRSYSRCCRFVGNGKTSWMPHPDTPSMAQAHLMHGEGRHAWHTVNQALSCTLYSLVRFFFFSFAGWGKAGVGPPAILVWTEMKSTSEERDFPGSVSLNA